MSISEAENPELTAEEKRDPTQVRDAVDEPEKETALPAETVAEAVLIPSRNFQDAGGTIIEQPAPSIPLQQQDLKNETAAETGEKGSDAGAEGPEEPRKNKRYVIQLRGLGWNTTVEDVFDFLDGMSAIKTVHIVAGRSGRTCGEAMVEFTNEESYISSFKHNNQMLHKRVIEIKPGNASELDRSLGRTPRAKVPTNPMSYVIRMRGVPYTATVEDIEDFFGKLKPDAIHIPRDEFGRPSGDAFVEFSKQEDGYLATYRHRDCIGNRYIEIFQSTIKELCSTMGMQVKSTSKKHWIKMQGLPYGTKLRQVLEFFASVKVFPIRLARRSDGSQVFAEFYTPQEVNNMMKLQQRYIGHRYVEFFPCDVQEVEKSTGKKFGPVTAKNRRPPQHMQPGPGHFQPPSGPYYAMRGPGGPAPNPIRGPVPNRT